MMRRAGFVVVGGMTVMAGAAAAQQPASPGMDLGWQQTDTDAPSLRYDLSVDGGAGQALTSVTCTPGAPAPLHDCQAPLPLLAQGTHTLTLRAVRTVSGVEFASDESAPVDIVFAERPSTPGTIIIILMP